MSQPPKHNPARRNARVGPVELPASGFAGQVPKWPLGSASSAEKSAWTDLWRTPQAHAWDRLGWTRTVARYCRVMVESERPRSSPALLAQATALEDRLGLTPKSMRLLLWVIADDELSERREQATAAAAVAPRLVAVDDVGS